MYTEREIERIQKNVYWEMKLKRIMDDDDCSDRLRAECIQDIAKLNRDSNMIEYGTPHKPCEMTNE